MQSSICNWVKLYAVIPLVFIFFPYLISSAAAIDRPAPRKIALVIGNSNYENSPLKNATNDATQVSAALKKLGFDVVYKENADFPTMLEAFRDFSRDARSSQIRLFYYAGHGLQMNGSNYLIPVASSLHNESEILTKTADVSGLIQRVANIREGVSIFILDTCRQLPNEYRILQTATRGLAKTDVPEGTIVAFSTGPGAKAIDGDVFNNNNSVYTKHLLKWIDAPGLPIERLFKQVRRDVIEETKGIQRPWDNVNIIGDFCLRPGPNLRCGD